MRRTAPCFHPRSVSVGQCSEETCSSTADQSRTVSASVCFGRRPLTRELCTLPLPCMRLRRLASFVAGFCSSCGRTTLASRPRIGGASLRATTPCRGCSLTTRSRGRRRAGRSSPRVQAPRPTAVGSAFGREALSDLPCCSAVDEEFEDVATQVLNRTCAMVNKYRRLLMVEAEVGAQTGLFLFFSTPCSDSSPFPAAFQSFFRNGDARQDLQRGGAPHPDAGQASGARGSRWDTEGVGSLQERLFNPAPFPPQTLFWTTSAVG